MQEPKAETPAEAPVTVREPDVILPAESAGGTQEDPAGSQAAQEIPAADTPGDPGAPEGKQPETAAAEPSGSAPERAPETETKPEKEKESGKKNEKKPEKEAAPKQEKPAAQKTAKPVPAATAKPQAQSGGPPAKAPGQAARPEPPAPGSGYPGTRNLVKYPVFSKTYPSRRLRLQGDPEAWAGVPGIRIWPLPGGSSPMQQMLQP